MWMKGKQQASNDQVCRIKGTARVRNGIESGKSRNAEDKWQTAAKSLKALALGAAIIGLSACSLLPKEEEALQPPLVKPVKENFEVVAAKKGTIARTVAGVATFASNQTQYLSFKQSGDRLLAIDVKLGDTVKKGDIVARLDKGDLETKIRQQELSIEKAQIALQQTKEDKRGDVQAVRLKMIDIESAQIALDQLHTQYDRMNLVSNISGVVTYIENMKQGDQVTAYKSIITISDPTQMRLTYEFGSTGDLTGIQVGMDVDLKFKNSPFKGKIVQIPATAPQSEVKAVQEKNAKTIAFSTDALPGNAAIGNTADFTITVEKKEGVVIIPRQGLRSYLGRDYVQIMDGESRKELDVEKGIVSATEVEIRKGLQEGQKVIINN